MKSMMKMCVAAALVLALGVGFANAVNNEKKTETPPAHQTVVGKVHVTKDAQGQVTAIKLVAEKATYNVTLDTKGKELAKDDGKEVQAKGAVTEKSGAKWITVHEFKVVAAKAAPAPAPKK